MKKNFIKLDTAVAYLSSEDIAETYSLIRTDRLTD